MLRRPAARRVLLWALLPLALACGAPEAPAVAVAETGGQPRSAWVEIGDDLFELELALDPATRFRGLSGRGHVARDGGMLFVFERSRPLAMVMRHCPVPIDVAFLDESGRVVGLHAMRVEAAQGPGESARAYEQRLPAYRSGAPARFAVEVAGGRLAEVGISVGDMLVFDTDALRKLAD